MIKLCYVEGINEVNTPYFADINAQNVFFDSAVVWQDDESYYPPYFMNAIRLSSEDIPFNNLSKKVNYCFIDYEGKRYYYFIDSIDYVTDDLVEISIEMDTIQTYFFNILVNRAVVSRQAINRWGDDGTSINRNYIRENLSNGNMRKQYKKSLGDESPLKWIVIRCASIPALTAENINSLEAIPEAKIMRGWYGDIEYETSHGVTSHTQTGGATILIPYGEWFKDSSSLTVTYGKDYTISNMKFFMQYLASNAEVLGISYIPYNPFPFVIYETGHITVNPSVARIGTDNYNWYYLDLVKTKDAGSYEGFAIRFPWLQENGYIEGLRMQSKEQTLNLGYSKSASKNNIYSSKYVPAMMDENYEAIKVGDNSGTTIAPLFYSEGSYIVPMMLASLKGERIYSFFMSKDILGNTYGNAFKDPHNIVLVNDNTLDYDLFTDPWKSYQVTHKGSIVTDWVATGLGAVTKGAGVAGLAQVSNNIAGAKEEPASASVGSYTGLDLTANGYRTGFTEYRMPRFVNTPRRGDKGRWARNELYPIGGN